MEQPVSNRQDYVDEYIMSWVDTIFAILQFSLEHASGQS